MGLYAIKQQVDSGNNFAGLAPDGVEADANGVRTFAWGTQAGLFEFPTSSLPYDIHQVAIKFGGQTTWSIVIVDGAFEFPWLSGTTEASLFTTAGQLVTIPPGAKLKLVTAGTITAAMEAVVMFVPSAIGQS